MSSKKVKTKDAQTWQWVKIEDIIEEASFQSTNRFEMSTAKEYATKYKAGEDMPPVELALVKGKLVLIDGAHRKAAQKLNGEYQIKAIVTPMTLAEAAIAALKANTTNGKQLTLNQRREKVQRLYELKLYKDEYGNPRSFQAMAKLINNVYSDDSIANWIKKYHPRTYSWIDTNLPHRKRKREYTGPLGLGGGGAHKVNIQLKGAKEHLNNAELAFFSVQNESERTGIIREAEEMLKRMEEHDIKARREEENEPF
jgi:hypothetical protein